MDDIAPKLIENVNKDFADNLAADKNVAALSEKLAAGHARYEDAYKYAESVGNARAKAFEDQISSEVLPEGKMHYNIASRLMTDSLTTDHEMIADYAAGVQKAYNEEAGINLKALKADVNEDRIDGFVERLSSEDVFDDVSWILQEPVVTHARSVVDDTIKKNAEFQGRAGIKATVIRNADPKCCKWCSDLAGDYVYPSVPREIFQRHDHCRCTVDYKGRRLSTYAVASNNIWRMRDSHTFRDLGEQDRIDKAKTIEGLITKNKEKIKSLQEISRDVKISVEELVKYVDKPISKTDNQSVREWYVANVSNIPNKIDRSKTIEEQAKQAFDLRNKLKHDARVAMSDEKTAAKLERVFPAPEWEELIKDKMTRKTLTREEAVRDILETASKTNNDVNKEFGL